MPNKSAGITFALTYTAGRRQFVATLGTNKHITMDKLDLSTLEDQDLSNIHLHRSGFWYTPRLKGQPTIELFKKVISQGGETSLDVGWDPEGFSEQNRNVLFQTLKYTKFFFANEKEIKAMTQENDIKQAYDILLNNSDIIEDPVIVVHRGERGCGIIRKEKREFIKPIVLEELINPTGSGDIFNGGFIHGLLNDLSNKKSAEFANLAACVHISDIEKIYPTLEEIEIFKKAQNK